MSREVCCKVHSAWGWSFHCFFWEATDYKENGRIIVLERGYYLEINNGRALGSCAMTDETTR